MKFLRELNIILIIFFFTTFFAFLLLNGGAFWRDVRYALFLNSPFASADLREGEILEVPGAGGGERVTLAPGTKPMQLVIPKIGVTAPVVIPRSDSKKAILGSLEEGVGLYPGSVGPGDNGRAVILGHSSRATWYRGDYATVFTLLGKLEAPDEFYITTEKKKYVYQVFDADILTPRDANALFAGPAEGSEVNLVTCYPIGGASKRTVVRARLVRVEDI